MENKIHIFGPPYNILYVNNSRHTPVDKWFHMAAAWDQDTNEAYLVLDGQKVGTQAQANGSFLRDNSNRVYDIGLKRDTGETLRGYLKDLIIIGKALTQEELANVTGNLKLLWSITITLSMLS